jgi:hypothetical protein
VSSVSVEGEGVDHEGVAEEVEVLAVVPEAVRSAEPEGVVEGVVDGFGVVAQREQRGEVGVAWWDGAEVFGAVELSGGIGGGAVEPHGDGGVPVAVGELVVVVPAVGAALVLGAMREALFSTFTSRPSRTGFVVENTSVVIVP